MTQTLQRLLTMTPAADRRSSDPAKNYGVRPAVLAFVVRGPLGATAWSLLTGLHAPHVVDEEAHRLQREGLSAAGANLLRMHLTDAGLTAENVYARLREAPVVLRRAGAEWDDGPWRPVGEMLSYHSPSPLAGWQQGAPPVHAECPYLGGPCWSDGSATAGEEVEELYLLAGEEAMWRRLEAFYEETFGR